MPAAATAAQSRSVDAPGTLLELADAIDAAEAAESQVILSTAAARPAAMGTLDPSARRRRTDDRHDAVHRER